MTILTHDWFRMGYKIILKYTQGLRLGNIPVNTFLANTALKHTKPNRNQVESNTAPRYTEKPGVSLTSHISHPSFVSF